MSARMRVNGRAASVILTAAAVASLLGLAGCEMMDGRMTGGADRWSAPGRWRAARKPAGDAVPQAPEPKILPVTYFRTGQIHELRGAPELALEQYRKAIALNHKFVAAYNRAGIVLDRLGRYDEANDAFFKALDLEPDAAYLRNNLAFSYMLQHQWLAAEAELRNALQVAPRFARARINLGVTLGRLGRYDEARAQFKEVLPEAGAAYNLGLLYRADRDEAKALAAFEQALAMQPTLAAAQTQIESIRAAQQAETARVAAAPAAERSAPPELAVSEPDTETPVPMLETDAPVPTPAAEAGVTESSVREASVSEPTDDTPEPAVPAAEAQAIEGEAPQAEMPAEETEKNTVKNTVPDEPISAVPEERTPEPVVVDNVPEPAEPVAITESFTEGTLVMPAPTTDAQAPLVLLAEEPVDPVESAPKQPREPLFRLDPMIAPATQALAHGLGNLTDTLADAGQEAREALAILGEAEVAQKLRLAAAAADALAIRRRALSLRTIALARSALLHQVRKAAAQACADSVPDELPTPVAPEPVALTDPEVLSDEAIAAEFEWYVGVMDGVRLAAEVEARDKSVTEALPELPELPEPLPAPVVPEPVALDPATDPEPAAVVEMPEEAVVVSAVDTPTEPVPAELPETLPEPVAPEPAEMAVEATVVADGDVVSGAETETEAPHDATATPTDDAAAVRAAVADAFPAPAAPELPPVEVMWSEPVTVREPWFRLDPVIAPATEAVVISLRRLHRDLGQFRMAMHSGLDVLHDAVVAQERRRAAEARVIARRSLSLRIIALARQSIVKRLRVEAERNRHLGRKAWLALLSDTLRQRPQTLAAFEPKFTDDTLEPAAIQATEPAEPSDVKRPPAEAPAVPSGSVMLVQADESLLVAEAALVGAEEEAVIEPPAPAVAEEGDVSEGDAVESEPAAEEAVDPKRPDEQCRDEVVAPLQTVRNRAYSLTLLALAQHEVNQQVRAELDAAEAAEWMRAIAEAADRGVLVRDLDTVATTTDPSVDRISAEQE